MGKERFLFRLFLVAAGFLFVTGAIFYARYSRYPRRSLALVHLSNSLCYNSNIQNLVSNTDIDKLDCLILGSSISLENLSGKMLEDSLGLKTYNLSSWGFPVWATIEFFNTIHPKKCRSVVVAFNNVDFPGARELTSDVANSTQYKFTESGYFLQGNPLIKLLVLLKTFNFMQFNSDTKYKDSVIRRSPLDFDAHGSVLLDPIRFPRDDKKLDLYRDTAGFATFNTDLLKLRELLRKRNVTLTLIYSPYRAGSLNDTQLRNCDVVARQMRNDFGSDLIDLHRMAVADSLYWDGIHMYKDGAFEFTERAISTINRQNGL
jgi:hypothetical protein